METFDVETPHGPARVHLRRPAGGETARHLVLGHGAGGSIEAPDLRAVAAVALEVGFNVALVEQPYRVAGRRSAAPAHQLDLAWDRVVGAVYDRTDGGLELYAGGRSSGARVACRMWVATGARGVLCLAFPLHPPGKPEKTRLPELEAVDVPVLVIQGERDPFGMPEPAPGREVVQVAGDHGLKRDLPAVAAAARAWLAGR
jgi:hypothetical protein